MKTIAKPIAMRDVVPHLRIMHFPFSKRNRAGGVRKGLFRVHQIREEIHFQKITCNPRSSRCCPQRQQDMLISQNHLAKVSNKMVE